MKQNIEKEDDLKNIPVDWAKSLSCNKSFCGGAAYPPYDINKRFNCDNKIGKKNG